MSPTSNAQLSGVTLSCHFHPFLIAFRPIFSLPLDPEKTGELKKKSIGNLPLEGY